MHIGRDSSNHTRALDTQSPIRQRPDMGITAFSLKLRANAPETRKQLPITTDAYRAAGRLATTATEPVGRLLRTFCDQVNRTSWNLEGGFLGHAAALS
jgi:hypothetical protein